MFCPGLVVLQGDYAGIDPINKFSVISYPADAAAARLPADPSGPPPPSGPHALHRALRAEGRSEEDESRDGPGGPEQEIWQGRRALPPLWPI